MTTTNTPNPAACSCPSGGGSLKWPCPTHAPMQWHLVPADLPREMADAGHTAGGHGMDVEQWRGRLIAAWPHMLTAAPSPASHADLRRLGAVTLALISGKYQLAGDVPASLEGLSLTEAQLEAFARAALAAPSPAQSAPADERADYNVFCDAAEEAGYARPDESRTHNRLELDRAMYAGWQLARAALVAAPAASQVVPVEMGHGTVAVGTCARSTDGVPGIVYLRIPGAPRAHDTDCGDIYPVGQAAPEGSMLACVYFLTADTLQQSIDTLLELQAKHYPAPVQDVAPSDARDNFDVVGAMLQIGAAARTLSTVRENIENLQRRSACLSAIERVFFTVATEPDPDEDDEYPGEECLLNWGANPDTYVEQFRAALATIGGTPPAAQAVPDAQPVMRVRVRREYQTGDVLPLEELSTSAWMDALPHGTVLDLYAAPQPTAREYACPVNTVADLVNNLLMMNQSLPIHAVQYITIAGRRRAVTVPPTVSIERVQDGRWIGEGDSLNAAVIWTRAAHPSVQAQNDPSGAEWDADDLREFQAIGRAVNRAALDLPVGASLQINLEKDAGTVCWVDDAHDDWQDVDSGGEPFSVQINSAIDAARAQQDGGAS